MYKLRIYKLSGVDKGNLDHEELFDTKEQMDKRYDELFKKDLYGLNPTAWEMTNGNDWRDINMFKYIISYDGGQLRDNGE